MVRSPTEPRFEGPTLRQLLTTRKSFKDNSPDAKRPPTVRNVSPDISIAAEATDKLQQYLARGRRKIQFEARVHYGDSTTH